MMTEGRMTGAGTTASTSATWSRASKRLSGTTNSSIPIICMLSVVFIFYLS